MITATESAKLSNEVKTKMYEKERNEIANFCETVCAKAISEGVAQGRRFAEGIRVRGMDTFAIGLYLNNCGYSVRRTWEDGATVLYISW